MAYSGLPAMALYTRLIFARFALGRARARGVAFSIGGGLCLVFAESWVARRARCVRLRGFLSRDPHQLKSELEPHHLDLWPRYAIAEAS